MERLVFRKCGGPTLARRAARHGQAARGFSIVELILVVSILAVLVGLLLPTLTGVRDRAEEVSSLAHQRQVGSLLLGPYRDTRAGAFPFYGEAGTNRARLCLRSFEDCVDDAYWSQPHKWSFHMRWQGYETAFAELGWPAVPGPEHADAGGFALDTLTHAAFAPPHFWTGESEQLASDHQQQFWHTIASPSQKAILRRWSPLTDFEQQGAYKSWRVVLWLGDEHAEVRTLGELRPYVPLKGWAPSGDPGLTTLNGLAGRDL